jgi:hypothetical protein
VTKRCEKSGGKDVRLNPQVSGSSVDDYNPLDCMQLDIANNYIIRDIYQNFLPNNDLLVQDVDASGVICSDEQRPNYTQLYETNEVEGKEHASLDLGMRKQPCIDVILGRHFSMPTQRMENSSDCDSNTHQTSALETPASNVLSPLSMRAEKPATPLSQDIGQNSQVCGSGLDIYNPFSCLQIDTSCSNKDGELVVQGEQVAEIETSEELKMEMSPNSAQDKSNTKDALKYVPPLVYNSVDGLRRSLRCNVPVGAKAKTPPFARGLRCSRWSDGDKTGRDTLRSIRHQTKACDEVILPCGLVQLGGPRAIRPIVTGPVWPLRVTGLICNGIPVITVCNPVLWEYSGDNLGV